ncbi:unnamed protein product [Paramecium sonneborni]|uniref:Uncharacterized protein n=1 Tax=Paramecium sonneborni TaxID=65129 RepID=A0A8S1PHG9_9CILI|nr:unnamed protein product [Paramecium sonneborni]
MKKQIYVCLLIFLIIGQAQCSFLDDLKTGGEIFASTTVGATIVAKGGLTILGFSSTGPIAGTFAAATQAGIGNVIAGSAFATAQSLAMSGIVAVAGPALVVGAVTGAVYVVYQQF